MEKQYPNFSIFTNKSLQFQITSIMIIILLIPILIMLYDIFFASKEDEVLFLTNRERLAVLTQNLVKDIESSIEESSIDLKSLNVNEKTAFLQAVFQDTAGPMAGSNPGVRMGLYIPENEEIFVQGYLHSYRKLTEDEEQEREKRILNEAHSGLVAVTASKEPISKLTSTFDDQVFESLAPVLQDGQLVAVVWADERLHPIFTQSRNFRVLVRYVTLLVFFFGAIGALVVIHNLASGVGRLKNGLSRLEKDIHYLLPGMPGELGQVAAAINKMAVALVEKEKLEAELHRSERLAALGRLVTGVAHELRNPIGVIKATVQVMEKDFEMIPGMSDYSTVIKEQVDRQNRVIQELLDFGRPSTPVVQILSVNALLQGVLTFTEPLLRQHKIKLTKEMGRDLPLVKVDGERLKQVFVNLILNAVQAMPDGGRLTLATSVEGQSVHISFTDTGEGISEDDLPCIFDPFYTTKDGGTGLGLSISHQIIKVHGGTINVSSTKSQGTTFTVIIPAVSE